MMKPCSNPCASPSGLALGPKEMPRKPSSTCCSAASCAKIACRSVSSTSARNFTKTQWRIIGAASVGGAAAGEVEDRGGGEAVLGAHQPGHHVGGLLDLEEAAAGDAGEHVVD